MKIFSTLHNPESEKYAAFYCIVLSVVCAVLLLSIFQLIRLSSLEIAALFFEGFASTYMLSRHKKTKAALGGIVKYLVS